MNAQHNSRCQQPRTNRWHDESPRSKFQFNTAYRLIRLGLMFLGLSLPFCAKIHSVCAEEPAPKIVFSSSEADVPAVTTDTTEEAIEAPLTPPTYQRAPKRAAPKVIAPEDFENNKAKTEKPESKNIGRSQLIPTVWSNQAQLIPTEIDADVVPIQTMSGVNSGRPNAPNPLRPNRPNPAGRRTKRAIYTPQPHTKSAVQPVHGPEPLVEALFLPALGVNSLVGIATFSKVYGNTANPPNGTNSIPGSEIGQGIVTSLETRRNQPVTPAPVTTKAKQGPPKASSKQATPAPKNSVADEESPVTTAPEAKMPELLPNEDLRPQVVQPNKNKSKKK